MAKQVKMKYPWASIDRTQAEGRYSLHVALAENISIEVYLEQQDIDYLKQQLKIMEQVKRMTQ